MQILEKIANNRDCYDSVLEAVLENMGNEILTEGLFSKAPEKFHSESKKNI